MKTEDTINPLKPYRPKMSAIVAVIVLTFALSISHTAHALNCYQKSPRFGRLGDNYFKEYIIQLSKSQLDNLSSLGESLAGEWKGSIEEFECKGPDKSAHKIKHRGDVKVTITEDKNKGVRFELNKYYQEEKRHSSENLESFNKNLIRSIELSKHRIHTSETFRATSSHEGYNSIFIENNIFITLLGEKSGTNIAIEYIRYVNGHYVSSITMRLAR